MTLSVFWWKNRFMRMKETYLNCVFALTHLDTNSFTHCMECKSTGGKTVSRNSSCNPFYKLTHITCINLWLASPEHGVSTGLSKTKSESFLILMQRFSVRSEVCLCDNWTLNRQFSRLIQWLHKVVWWNIVVQVGVPLYREAALARFSLKCWLCPEREHTNRKLEIVT